VTVIIKCLSSATFSKAFDAAFMWSFVLYSDN